jgi:tetratricopeptide (TPR) repeat protein
MTRSDRFRMALLLLIVLGVAFVVRPFVFASETIRLTRNAATALSRGNWSLARRFSEQALVQEADDRDAIAIAGIACARQHEHDDSLVFLQRFAETDSEDRPLLQTAVLVELGRRYRRLGRLFEAEQWFREALSVDNLSLPAHRQLHHILAFEGRCAEAAPHLLAQVQSGVFHADELYVLGIPERIVIDDDRLREQCQANDPDDPLRQLGHARIMVADHKLKAAEPLLERIASRYPHLPLAHSLLGEIYLEQNRTNEFLAWYQSLSDEVMSAPEIWYVCSLWARETGQTKAAVRCLLETLKSYPSHVRANYQLSQLFQQLGEHDRARFFSERSRHLSTLDYVINDLRGNPDERLMRQAVNALELLGRGWEAIAWCYMAKDWGGEDWAPHEFSRLRHMVAREKNAVVSEFDPLNGIHHEKYPLPKWSRNDESVSATSERSLGDTVQFEDAAAVSGLDFQYFNSMNPDVGLEHIFQTTGGGVAALDFDLDLWPDLYFGNGRILPETVAELNEPQTLHLGALYRNRGNGGYVAVTSMAAVGDDRFSQGVSAGDVNNDGFPDIYVANVGRNRLYQNNGDGTFTNISVESATEGDVWTMSAMIADIDADGLSDIYAVNYLNMEQVFNRSCKKDGEPLTCAPTLFDAELDRLYRNRGDGTFEDATDRFGFTDPKGKGLGVVGLHVEGRPGLQLFVANDTTENQYFESVATERQGPMYAENAMLAGLAMSESGNIQACMGVAAGDADGNGSIDLFVTNFYADSNTMYLQTAPGMFIDSSRACALAEPSYGMLGFGTQFLDADLDGHLDLIITNGHVDQTFATGEPDRMPPQFFLNSGQGNFVELKDSLPGSFFEQLRIGRALTRLDWNRDGKNDACIVHLDAPVALLNNETETENSSVVIHLRGTADSRDAIGASVTLVTKQQKYVRQLTGGDGYQATNERKIIFGLPSGQTPSSLHIRWLDGSHTLVSVPLTGELIAIQGQGVFRLL